MVKIEYFGKYEHMLEELINTDNKLLFVVNERVKLFRRNPEDTRLDNHSLTRRMSGKWAFAITYD